MTTSSFVAALCDLGRVSSFNPDKLSSSTMKSVASHIRTLQHNKVSLEKKILTTNTVEVLNTLKDRQGKKLKNPYKRQIGMTIKRMYPDVEINLKPFGKGRNKKSTRMASDEFMSTIKRIIERASVIINLTFEKNSIEDLGLYDACLVILISICTSLRIFEIEQLKMHHMTTIESNEAVGIQSKGTRNFRIIAPNDLLLNLFRAIRLQRPKVIDNVAQKKYDSKTKYRQRKIDEKYIIISSEAHMRKKLHEIASSLFIPNSVLGFTTFRKFITSILIEGGGHLIAQSLNNHSSVNTTLDHYSVIGSAATENAFAEMNNLMRTLVPNLISKPPSPPPPPGIETTNLIVDNNKGDVEMVNTDAEE